MSENSTHQNIPAALRAAALEYGQQDALRFPGQAVSFAQIDASSDRLARHLLDQGLQEGERIALYCPNSTAFVIGYCAILKAGGVVVPLNLLHHPEELAYICSDAGVCGLLYHPVFATQVASFAPQVTSLGFQILMDESQPNSQWHTLLNTEATPVLSWPAQASSDLAVILYTSGTTGRAKGAMLSHGNLLANASSVFRVLKLHPGQDCLLVVLPMFHAFAATVGLLTPLLHGLCLAPVARFEPQLITDSIEATGASIFLGVPSMYNLLSRLPAEQIARWRSIRFGVAGGAAMPVELLKRFESLYGFPILEGDGPTECGPVTSVNPLDGVRKPGSVGLEIPDVEVSIRNDHGQPLVVGEIGEICVRGPNVMQGYWKRPEATVEVFFGDWLRTGDLGYKDEEGYIFMVDRKKDMIIVNGMNVYPRMIEEVLFAHPQVQEAAVVGEPHESHGEIPVAHIVLTAGSGLDVQTLREYCRAHLGSYQVPRKFVIREAPLPKNAAGKVLKRELRKAGELERGIDSREG